MGSRIYASDTPAAVPSAIRPTTRDEVHRGTTVKIASPRSPLDKSLQSTGWPIQPALLLQPVLFSSAGSYGRYLPSWSGRDVCLDRQAAQGLSADCRRPG